MNLSKEEIEKAKEFMNNIKQTIQENNMLFGEENITIKAGKETAQNIEILLQYIQELEKSDASKEQSSMNYYNECKELKQENKKLNKMIDEMAKELDKLQDELFTKCFIPQKYSNINDCARKRSCVECIKQYFKEKVEGKLNAKN